MRYVKSGVYINAAVVLAGLVLGDYGLAHRGTVAPHAKAPIYRDAPEARSTLASREFRPAIATSPAAAGG